MRIDVKRTTTNEKTGVLAVLLILVAALPEISECSTHWKVTELGRIESNEDSPFTLLRPYDLASFLQQIERSARLDELKKIIISKDIPTGKDPSNRSISSRCRFMVDFIVFSIVRFGGRVKLSREVL